jgi:ribosomal protein L35
MKTNKSYSKRLKITKNGKILARKTGQNHFNAKESGRKQLARRGCSASFVMTGKAKSRFINQI